MPTCQGRCAPPEAVALSLPLARTILKYALFYHGTGHLQKILNIAKYALFYHGTGHLQKILNIAHQTRSNHPTVSQPRRHFSTARAARSAGFMPVAQAKACAKSVGGIQNPELTITSLFCLTQSPPTSAHASPSSRYYRQRVSGKRYEQSCP